MTLPAGARELQLLDVARLQAFFDENPEYFLITHGQLPGEQEALTEFNDLPPAEMTFSKRWFLEFVDGDGQMIGVASLFEDLFAAQVWTLALFIVASHLHGTGRAKEIYTRLERWVQTQGAAWIRLGVVKGNTKPEHFWAQMGYCQVRERGPIEMGLLSNTLRVLVKPLAGGLVADYLALVTRDQPGMP